MGRAQDVLAFWLDEVGSKGWYNATPELDAAIRDRFLADWHEAREGAFGLWLTCASETLAYIILTDQFPRNMFRNHADAFATDDNARAAAKMALNKGWDLQIDEPARQFFYMPLMHAENAADQDRAVRLIHSRMPQTGAGNIDHARVHREIIRMFGRFPYRNPALGRVSTAEEEAFLSGGGYGKIMQALTAAADAV